MKNIRLWLLLTALFASGASAQTVTIPSYTITIPAQTLTVPAQTITVALPAVDAGVPPVVDAGVPPAVDASVPVDAGSDAGTPPPPPQGGTARPEASKGVGFYVVGSRLFDANGKEFIMRGTNATHVDQQSQPLKNFKANTNRFINYFYNDPDRVLRDMQDASNGYSTASGKVQMPGMWDGPKGTLTCRADLNAFNSAVDVWVRDAKKYQSVERFTMLNIANEWGDNETAWRDAYVAAIPRIRAAGWNGAIVVDAPGCGQNGMALARHGAAILAADPQKNVIFDWHIYGNVYDSVGGVAKQWSEQLDLLPTMNALKDAKIAVVVGEIGPGRNIGPSPTMVKPERIVKLAEERGFGWLLWSHDDNDGGNSTSSESSFGMFKINNVYKSDADLTQWGRVAKALWEQYAVPASIFSK